MATSRGMDVSIYQSPQDWAALKSKGLTFAFAKASEGQHSRDDRFDTHIGGIIKAGGLIPGAYHFGWPTQDVATEAANYIGAVKPYARPGFVHWLDLERYSDGRNYGSRNATQIRTWVAEWLRLVGKAFPGQRVGVYTSADDVAAGHLPAGVPLWFPSYPWGAADWSRAESAAQPTVSGRTPLIWQFTSQPYDRSVAYLSPGALRAWAQGDTIKEEDPVPQYVNLGLVKPYEIKPGAWDSIEFTKEWTDETGDHATGGSVFVRGAARFAGSLSVTVTGLPVGDVVQARMSEYAGDTFVQDHPIHEVIGTPGGAYAVVPLVKRVPAGHGMRVRLLNQSKAAVTITSATLAALVYKEA
ncbi:glycoside hydrolase family 25 protein [Streptomyces sp. NPDC051014]|uniref:glycoside hydrolase family 25 protein n=1 Tax=Streptomyces sp. NPDC051014 TaxID=3155751 RepID=UPI0033FF3ADA